MADITLTDTNPVVTKATGGGGRAAEVDTEVSPTHLEYSGGGHTYPVTTDLPPLIDGTKTPPGLDPDLYEVMR